MKLDNKEAIACVGGATLTAAFINALKGIYNTIYEFGQNLGSSISRALRGISC